MRISTRQMYGALAERLVEQGDRLVAAQRRISTGERLLRPADDPAGAGRVVVLEGRLSDIEQYRRNADSAIAALGAADTALDDAIQTVREARRLALAGANDTKSEPERRLMAAQVDGLIDRLRQAAETRHGGRFVFAGTSTRTSPLAPTGDPTDPYAYAGNDALHLVEVGDGVTVATNVSGRAVFQFGAGDGTGASNAFAALARVRDDLLRGDPESLSAAVETLDGLLKNLSTHRGEIGQRIQRLEGAKTHLAQQQESLQALQSSISDADLALAVVDYETQQTVYQATVALAARVDQPGLFEFLRG